MRKNKNMKHLKLLIGVVAAMGLASSAYAVPTISVSDAGGGLSLVPVTSASGAVTYSSSDGFWSIVISTGLSSPPLLGQGTLASPVMDLSVTAISTGISGADAHPLTITFSSDGFGPSVGTFDASITGQLVAGTAHPVTFSTFYSTANAIPALTPLTTTTLSGPSYNGTAIGTAGSLGTPYSLSEVVTISAVAGSGAQYSLDAKLVSVPDGGMTVALLGVSLVVLAGVGAARGKKLAA